MAQNQIVAGSLADIAARNNMPLAQVWLNVDAVILVDVSGSMDTADGHGTETRIAIAQRELKKLQATLPGKLAIFAFSSETEYNPTGYLPGTMGSTNLTRGLETVHPADCIPDMKFIVISDGQPDNPESALAVARTFKNKIDVIYIGPEGGAGAAFLRKLAAATGGTSITKSELPKLAENTMKLLEAKNAK